MPLIAVAGNSGTGPRVNPLLYGNPFHAFWAEDDTLAATADSTEITSWTNHGSNGVAATESSGTAPQLLKDGINGKAALDFDGVDQRLFITAGDTDTLTDPGTVVCVFEYDGTPDGDNVYSGRGSASARWFIDAPTSTLRMYGGTARNLVAISSATAYVTACVFDASAAVGRVNGVEEYSGAGSGSNHLDGLTIAANYTTGGADYLDGKIAFLGVYGSDITGESWFAELEQGLIDYYRAGS